MSNQVTPNLVPRESNGASIGTSSRRWKDGHFTNLYQAGERIYSKGDIDALIANVGTGQGVTRVAHDVSSLGSPNGYVVAEEGSLIMTADGQLWYKETGNDNQGWVFLVSGKEESELFDSGQVITASVEGLPSVVEAGLTLQEWVEWAFFPFKVSQVKNKFYKAGTTTEGPFERGVAQDLDFNIYLTTFNHHEDVGSIYLSGDYSSLTDPNTGTTTTLSIAGGTIPDAQVDARTEDQEVHSEALTAAHETFIVSVGTSFYRESGGTVEFQLFAPCEFVDPVFMAYMDSDMLATIPGGTFTFSNLDDDAGYTPVLEPHLISGIEGGGSVTKVQSYVDRHFYIAIPDGKTLTSVVDGNGFDLLKVLQTVAFTYRRADQSTVAYTLYYFPHPATMTNYEVTLSVV